MLGLLREEGLAHVRSKDLAHALRDHRRRSGKTLQEISDATGVSVGTLSKLENQKGTPSFRTLTRIIQLLDLSGGGSASREKPGNSALPASGFHATARKTVTLQGDALLAESDRAVMHVHSSELLDKDMFPMVAEITLKDVPPMENWSQHAGDEFLYVLDGEIEIHMEHYRPYVLRKGESTYYDSGMRHVVVSRTGKNATVLSVSTSR